MFSANGTRKLNTGVIDARTTISQSPTFVTFSGSVSSGHLTSSVVVKVSKAEKPMRKQNGII